MNEGTHAGLRGHRAKGNIGLMEHRAENIGVREHRAQTTSGWGNTWPREYQCEGIAVWGNIGIREYRTNGTQCGGNIGLLRIKLVHRQTPRGSTLGSLSPIFRLPNVSSARYCSRLRWVLIVALCPHGFIFMTVSVAKIDATCTADSPCVDGAADCTAGGTCACPTNYVANSDNTKCCKFI